MNGECFDKGGVDLEQSRRSTIFGSTTKAKAEVMIGLGPSIAGRVAGASPGPFPGALELVWRTIDPPPAARVADLGAGLGGASVWRYRGLDPVENL